MYQEYSEYLESVVEGGVWVEEGEPAEDEE